MSRAPNENEGRKNAMTVQPRPADVLSAAGHDPQRPSPTEVAAAARTLLRWAESGPSTDPELSDLVGLARTAAYPALERSYPAAFQADASYIATLPDLQNGPESLIKGAKTGIQHVGISNFRLPVRFRAREGGELTLETAVTGSVSLEANKKGINMSRIMRSFYKHAEESFSFEVIGGVLDSYLADLESYDARIQMRLSYPMMKPSLRSGLEGWQYYNVALEMVRSQDRTQRIIHLDYVYSSTCPCSLELSEHARRTRGQIATPHSQRSVARVSREVTGAGWLCSRTSSTSATPRSRPRPRSWSSARTSRPSPSSTALIRSSSRMRCACSARACRRTRGSAISGWWRATRNRSTAMTRCRS